MARSSRQPDEGEWTAILSRDGAAGFLYGVATTGIYCRPDCPSRRPSRVNVTIHADAAEAQAAGLRPCRRCRPDQQRPGAAHAEAVARACRRIEAAETAPTLAELAAEAALSPFHFQRVFKRLTGVSPKAYAAAERARRLRAALTEPGSSVTEAIYAAGFSSSGRFYEASPGALGMTPTAFRGGGEGTITFAVGECSLGSVLAAESERGICAILLGDDPETLVRSLQDQFPKAKLQAGDEGFEAVMAAVVGLVDDPAVGLELPLDIRGTAFQQRVWQALRAVPPGRTASYAEIAAAIGLPKAVRAVAAACAANRIGIAIPCHRVVRTDGALSGYRWGVDRKRALILKERGAARASHGSNLPAFPNG
ncbi:bifunctional DNA-binding transcriptional regulator/O6-methylguanine-DNA methyltransferase Ada [Mangrovicella endophytica]|uniref:bifunctional DNA-binding transcriptional regulator/O6-methylguanine-DNA methyltransferase Ada n=1 Tax=Mangrovicella endophytica TaxID=2066697 RepID=UPI000C9E6232|nr:bifunctional DNA-binding transcriptional regulator/O6-methylguanine-DNA methyltransferase Ada [Mangrovicella endophytica]